jgi:1-acyl-sn-glycerol-3-phosphate acyltransferase
VTQARESEVDGPSGAALGPGEVLEIVQALARELHPRRKPARRGLDASLERDLGFDSLGRVELVSRLERAYGVRLPESVLATAETPRDLVKALSEAGSATGALLATIDLVEPQAAAEGLPTEAGTLVEVLAWHLRRHPERRHVLFYPGEGAPEELTYGDLDRRARAVAAGLAGLGIGSARSRGAKVGIMLPTGLEYFAAFLGTLLAGGVPVPLYPPARKSQIEDHLRRQGGILDNAEASVLVTVPEVLPLARLLRVQLPGLKRLVTVEELSSSPAAAPPPAPLEGSDTAFLQYTSGSTGNPKGVVLTHANLLANLRAIGEGSEILPDDVIVSWLPLYHDMGLIGAWMGSLYYGLPLVLMSPLSFLARPSRWLWAIHRHRGTLSPAPNFAYEMCVQKIDDAEVEGLDLSSWRAALNGAEPVSPQVMGRFVERFSRYGFRREAMVPVYGLAECSLAVAFPPPGRGPRIDAVDREAFQRSGRADPAGEGEAHALRFVSCGLPLPGHEIRIVGDTGNELGERRQGRLEFRGPSATGGYHRNPEATARLLRPDGWLDSGDLAYIAEGEVFLTGRRKDVIIRGGRNLYPEELEEAVGQVSGVRKGCVAVFGSPHPDSGTERLVVLAEVRDEGEGERERIVQEIQGLAVDLLGSPPDDVVLASPHTVPKTSSGKIRRSSARQLYEERRLGRRGAALGWQLARLAGSAWRARFGRGLRAAGEMLYAGWVWLLVGLAAGPTALGMAVLPEKDLRRGFARRVARLLARLVRVPIEVEGLEHLRSCGRPVVVAANHQSYFDSFVLTAALPPDFAFVAKRELRDRTLPRYLLERLGTVFVERFDPAQGVGETRKALDALAAGDSVIVFPEGTFHRAPGLLPFRMGAFLVAAEAGVPVVPVTLRGTRSLLRGDEMFPRRGAAAVTVSPPLQPAGSDWAAAVALRDAARAEILARCGEPDIPSSLV